MARRTTTPEATAASDSSEHDESLGKGRPTPTRKEREEARKQPIVPKDRKLAARTDRAKQASERERARAGIAAGDERYLPARDKGEQRRYVRDYVDARWSVGEFLIPIVVVMLIATVIPVTAIQQWAEAAVWAFFAITIIDVVILGFRLRSRLSAKFGTVERGVRWYATMRVIQLRMIRLPKPQVARGAFPE